MSTRQYRKLCYDNYVSNHGKNNHNYSLDMYEHLSLIYKKRYSEILNFNKESQILDIACGPGYFLYFLERNGYENIYGIDLSEEQLKVAENNGVTKISNEDIFEYLPLHENHFDCIVGIDIIEHLQKDEIIVLLEMVYNSLKPNGKILLSTLNAQSLGGLSTFFSDFTHETAFTPISLMQVLQLSKFKKVIVNGEGPSVYNISSLLRSVLWKLLKRIYRAVTVITEGFGRDIFINKKIYESRMFVLGDKIEE